MSIDASIQNNLRNEIVDLTKEVTDLNKEVAKLRRSYVSPSIAAECLEALKPLEVSGEPNTLWSLVRKAMRRIAELEKELENKK